MSGDPKWVACSHCYGAGAYDEPHDGGDAGHCDWCNGVGQVPACPECGAADPEDEDASDCGVCRAPQADTTDEAIGERSEPVTLPGDIPGLRRHCTPMVATGPCPVMHPEAPTEEETRFAHGPFVALGGYPEGDGDAWVVDLEEGEVICVPAFAVGVDLGDPTGQAHAAWWAMAQRVPAWARPEDGDFVMEALRGKLDRAGQERLRDLVLRLAGVSDAE